MLKFLNPSMGAFGTPVIISRTQVAERVSGPVVMDNTARSFNRSTNFGIMEGSRMMFSPTPSNTTNKYPSGWTSKLAGKVMVPSGCSGSSRT